MTVNLCLLAFLQIGSPWMLGGLLLCGVPLLIHYFFRRSYRQLPWAAMRFLLKALESQSRRLRMESWLVLMLRCLLLMLVVLATVEPALVTARTWFGGREPIHRIFVVDLSASMGAKGVGGTSAIRAAHEVRQVVDSAIVGDSFQLVRIAGTAPHVIIRRPAHHGNDVLEELSRWPVTEEFGDVAASLQSVLDLLAEAPAQCEVTIVSDFQRANWAPGEPRASEEIATLLDRIESAARLTVIDVGNQSTNNLAVTSLTCRQLFAIPGGRFEVVAVVRNFGRSPVSQRLQWFLNGELTDVVPVELAAQAETTIVWTPTIRPMESPERSPRVGTPSPSPATGAGTAGRVVPTGQSPEQEVVRGDVNIVAKLLTEDRFPVDDVRFLTRPVRERLRLLIVNGARSDDSTGRRISAVGGLEEERPDANGAGFVDSAPPGLNGEDRAAMQGADFLQLALRPPESPIGTAHAGRVQFDVTTISDIDLMDAKLSDFDVVWLADVARLDDRESQELHRFAEQGGGLVVSLGERVDIENYATRLGSGESPVLPVELQQVVTPGVTSDQLVAFEPALRQHPLLQPFAGEDDGGLSTTYVFRYVKSQVPVGRAGEVIIRLTNGDPLIVAQPFGAGRVIAILTAPDDQWGTWALWPSFVPLVREVSSFAASGTGADREFLVAEPFQRILSTAWCSGPATLWGPLTGLSSTMSPGAGAPLQTQSSSESPTGANSEPERREQQASVRLEQSEGRCSWNSEGLLHAGFYVFESDRPGETMQIPVAINVDTRESSLAALNESDSIWEQVVGRQSQGRPGDLSNSQGGGPRRGLDRDAGNLSGWFLGMAAIILLIEQLSAWRPMAGILGLLVVMLCGAEYGLWSRAPGAAIALFLLVLAILLLRLSRRPESHPPAPRAIR